MNYFISLICFICVLLCCYISYVDANSVACNYEANLNDCSKYTDCTHSVDLSCPYGQLFNPTLQKCDAPTAVKCPMTSKLGKECSQRQNGIFGFIMYLLQFLFQTIQKCDTNTGLQCNGSRCQCPPIAPYWYLDKCNICPQGWALKGTSCYYLSTFVLTWFDSKQWCANHNSTLLIINSQNEFDMIMNWIPISSVNTKYYWVGLNDLDNQFDFVWEDGRHTTENDSWFYPNQPQNVTKDGIVKGCVNTCGDVKFLCNWNCTDPSNFICEKSLF